MANNKYKSKPHLTCNLNKIYQITNEKILEKP
jgi:hypothetical protein